MSDQDQIKAQVEAALAQARSKLQAHGGDVELLGLNDQGVVLVRLTGACAGCRSAEVTLKDIVEKTLLEAAPGIKRVEALL